MAAKKPAKRVPTPPGVRRAKPGISRWNPVETGYPARNRRQRPGAQEKARAQSNAKGYSPQRVREMGYETPFNANDQRGKLKAKPKKKSAISVNNPGKYKVKTGRDSFKTVVAKNTNAKGYVAPNARPKRKKPGNK